MPTRHADVILSILGAVIDRVSANRLYPVDLPEETNSHFMTGRMIDTVAEVNQTLQSHHCEEGWAVA